MNQAALVAPTPTRPSLSVPIAALVVGIAITAGAFALPDSEQSSPSPAKVIVVEPPAPGSEGVAAKDEARVAGAIAASPELRGSSASAVGNAASLPAPEPHVPRPAGPRGLAAGLSGR